MLADAQTSGGLLIAIREAGAGELRGGLARRGITVNAVSPGFVDYSVVKSLPEVAQKMISDWASSGWTPMGRLGTPADIGNVVALLCSEEARWITGQTIYADGGASIVMAELPPALQQG